MPQIRSHFEEAIKIGKPVVLGEFGKMHFGGMVQRKEFLEAVYAEVEAWNVGHGNVAGRLCSTRIIIGSKPGCPLDTAWLVCLKPSDSAHSTIDNG